MTHVRNIGVALVLALALPAAALGQYPPPSKPSSKQKAPKGPFHTFHVHGHRWRDAAGTFVDNPGFGPNEQLTARWREDNPGRWLYHCHVFTHQDGGMAGWYLVEP